MPLVEFKNVYKRYKMGEVVINAVDGISFSVEEGEFAVVVGTSGAGKTTVLNMLGGMDSAGEGEILVRGSDISRYSDRQLIEYRRHEIGFVFQFYNLVHNLTAKENVELAAQICRDPLDSEKALQSVGLLERKDNFPAQLSGGEQQRVSIARALAKRPALLLCDEPTGALDYNTGRQILGLLQETCRREKMTVILITHNTAITPMADHILEMKSGKIVRDVYNEHPKAISEISGDLFRVESGVVLTNRLIQGNQRCPARVHTVAPTLLRQYGAAFHMYGE